MNLFSKVRSVRRSLVVVLSMAVTGLCVACGDDDPRCCEPHAEWEYETVPPKNADKKTDTKKTSAADDDQQTDAEG